MTDGKDADGNAETTATIDDTHDVTITVTDADDPGSLTLSSQSPTVGSALTATLTDDDGGVTGETWKWESSPNDQNNWTVITGETTNSYTPDADDENKYLRVTVTYDGRRGLRRDCTGDHHQRGGGEAGDQRAPVVRRRDYHR